VTVDSEDRVVEHLCSKHKEFFAKRKYFFFGFVEHNRKKIVFNSVDVCLTPERIYICFLTKHTYDQQFK